MNTAQIVALWQSIDKPEENIHRGHFNPEEVYLTIPDFDYTLESYLEHLREKTLNSRQRLRLSLPHKLSQLTYSGLRHFTAKLLLTGEAAYKADIKQWLNKAFEEACAQEVIG